MTSVCNHNSPHGTLTDFNGSLEQVLLFDLYRQIYLTRQTGTLELSGGARVRRIIFRNGSVTFATTNLDSERLGQLLLAENRITREVLESAVDETRSGKRFGQVLVGHGVMGTAELDEYLRRHQSELAISALGMTRGTFRFSETLPEEYEDVFIDMSTADIIIEGTRRIQEPAVVQKLLGDPDRLLQVAVDPLLRFQSISLNAQEGYLLSRFERPMSIAEVCRMSALGETPTLRSLLGFVLAGILEYADASETGNSACADTATPAADESTTSHYNQAAEAPDMHAMQRMLDANTCYEVLGVPAHAQANQIRQAYLLLAQRYHPDKWNKTVSFELTEKAERVFQSVESAYRILADPVQRERYDGELSVSQGAEAASSHHYSVTGRVYASDVARRAFEKGQDFYLRRMYVAALEQFKEAVKLEDGIALYRFHLARTFARLPGRSREAEFHYCIAIHQSPWNGEFKKEYEKFRQNPAHHDRVESLFAAALADLDKEMQRKSGTKIGDSS